LKHQKHGVKHEKMWSLATAAKIATMAHGATIWINMANILAPSKTEPLETSSKLASRATSNLKHMPKPAEFGESKS
jgi:hypothetical protein